MPWRLATSCTAMKPTLCRLPENFAPGFPSPTRSCIGVVPRRKTSLLLGRGGRSSTRRSTRGGTRRRTRSARSARSAFGRRTSRGSSGGGSGGFGLRLHFFGVARRRHHGDEGYVAAGDGAHAFGQRDVAQMSGVVDLEIADIDVDAGWNGVGE